MDLSRPALGGTDTILVAPPTNIGLIANVRYIERNIPKKLNELFRLNEKNGCVI